MRVDAIILTGGRSSRLDSVPKSEFLVDGSTLLDRTMRAAAGSRRIVVVGHDPTTPLPDGVLLVREEPPFSGPVAAVAAGLVALTAATSSRHNGNSDAASEALLVLACDMPHIGRAVTALIQALVGSPDADGAIAVDVEGRRQPLAAVYRTNAFTVALDTAASHTTLGEPLAGLPMFRLLDHLHLVEVEVTHDATADVDTWDDAIRLGAQPPTHSTSSI